jgi:hypothetical protein
MNHKIIIAFTTVLLMATSCAEAPSNITPISTPIPTITPAKTIVDIVPEIPPQTTLYIKNPQAEAGMNSAKLTFDTTIPASVNVTVLKAESFWFKQMEPAVETKHVIYLSGLTTGQKYSAILEAYTEKGYDRTVVQFIVNGGSNIENQRHTGGYDPVAPQNQLGSPNNYSPPPARN